MLQLPSLETYTDTEDADFKAVIYGDDGEYWRFYVIPEVPRVRMDRNNNPVFLLTKYRFSDEDRRDNPELPKGGGFLVFDVELSIPNDNRERLMAHLNQRVQEEWRRRGRRDADAEYTGPEAVIASPEWTAGTTDFYVVDDPNLVKGHLTGEQTSMIGSNVAIFNATLTSAGATYMQKTLVDPGGEGGTDLANVQVKYNVSFWARLPPARIYAFARSREIYQSVASVWHDYEGRGCNEDISVTSEHYWSYAQQSDAMTLRIDTGAYEVDDDGIKELRSFVMNQFTTWISEVMLQKAEHTDPAFADIEDIYASTDDVYRLRTESSVENKTFLLNTTMTSITEKELHPQATLQTFFKGFSAEQMQQFVREVDLNDAFFTDIVLDVRAFARFDDSLAYVKVDVDYGGDVQSHTFHQGELDAVKMQWGMVNGEREYRYRYELGFSAEAEERKIVTSWQAETTRELNILVPDTGTVAVDVLAGNIDWKEIVQSVQVQLRYEDGANGVDPEGTTAILTEDSKSDSWKYVIYTKREKPVSYTQTFFLKDDQQIVIEGEAHDRRLVVNEPLINTVNANFVAAGDLETARQVIVDMLYEDPDDPTYRKLHTQVLNKDADFYTWRILVKNNEQDRFKYRYTVIPKDPDLPTYTFPESGGYSEEQENGSTITVDWPSPPRLKVVVRGTRLPIADDGLQEVEVFVRARHAIGDDDSEVATVFDASNHKSEQPELSVLVDADADEPKSYEWECRYFFADGSESTASGTSDRRFFWVPSP